jgi:hypothetical protein
VVSRRVAIDDSLIPSTATGRLFRSTLQVDSSGRLVRQITHGWFDMLKLLSRAGPGGSSRYIQRSQLT